MCGPARGRGGRLYVAERREKDQMHVSLSEMGAHVTVRPFLAVMLNSLALLFMIG